MPPTRRNFREAHPRLLINTQILWIVVGTGLLHQWLPRIASSWRAGETYNLPQAIAYSVIGLVIVVANFILVNSAIGRLAAKNPSDVGTGETESRSGSPRGAL